MLEVSGCPWSSAARPSAPGAAAGGTGAPPRARARRAAPDLGGAGDFARRHRASHRPVALHGVGDRGVPAVARGSCRRGGNRGIARWASPDRAASSRTTPAASWVWTWARRMSPSCSPTCAGACWHREPTVSSPCGAIPRARAPLIVQLVAELHRRLAWRAGAAARHRHRRAQSGRSAAPGAALAAGAAGVGRAKRLRAAPAPASTCPSSSTTTPISVRSPSSGGGPGAAIATSRTSRSPPASAPGTSSTGRSAAARPAWRAKSGTWRSTRAVRCAAAATAAAS